LGPRYAEPTTKEEVRMIDDDAHLEDMAEADASEVEYLSAQTATGFSVDSGGSITLKHVSPSTLWFSDRPQRLTGHIATGDFVTSWGEGGDDSFAADPPNAVLSIFEEDHVNDVVVILSEPTMSDGDLSYTAEVIDGELSSSGGPVGLYIDVLGRPLTPMSVAGVRRRGRRRGRRRMRRRL
jgi:hypothetical protein